MAENNIEKIVERIEVLEKEYMESDMREPQEELLELQSTHIELTGEKHVSDYMKLYWSEK